MKSKLLHYFKSLTSIFCKSILVLLSLFYSSNTFADNRTILTYTTESIILPYGFLPEIDQITFQSSGFLNGYVMGSGTVIIDMNYDNYNSTFSTYTQFGTSSSNVLANLTINSGRSLILNNTAYITTTTNNGTLTLNSGSFLAGTINGGTVNINTVYNNWDGANYTVFGESGNAITSLNITSGNSLTLSNNAYITNTTNEGTLTLTRDTGITGAIITGNIDTTGGTTNIYTDDAIDGSIYGTGSVVIGNNTDYDYNLTNFGTTTSALSSLTINSDSSLALRNSAYFDELLNLYGITNNGILYLYNGSNVQGNIDTVGTTYIYTDDAIDGAISGGGSVIIGNGTDIVDYYYNQTFFGYISSDALNSLVINVNSSLTLDNYAYITTTTNYGILTLNSGSRITGDIEVKTDGVVNIYTDDAINGSIYGDGSAVIGNGSVATDYNYDNTHFGTLSNALASLKIITNSSLTLNNTAYIERTRNYGTLNLNSGSFLTGIVNGGTVNINTDYNNLSGSNYTVFGESGDTITLLNIQNDGSLSLNNISYIDAINIYSESNTSYPSLSLIGDGISNISLNLNDATSGINYKKDISGNPTDFIGAVITLKNTTGDTNNEYMTQMYNLTQVLNNTAVDTSLDFSNNNLYLSILSRYVAVGTSFLIDSSLDFSEASLTYEGIYLNLKLRIAGNDLYLDVLNNRYPTTDVVSKATITAADVINNWTFSDETLHDMILVSNLQNIESDSDFYHALRDITPDVSGLNKEMAKKSLEISLSNVDKRLNTYRMMKFNSNSADYNMNRQKSKNIKYYEDYFTKPFNESNIWIEGFGGTLKQDDIENIYGYDATFTGFSLGYDIRVNNNFLFGLSYTFNQYDATNNDKVVATKDDMTGTTNNFDLYTMLYGKWAYLSLDAGGSYNEFKQQRKINFYNFDKIAKSDYRSYSYYGKSELGFNILLYKNANKEDTIIKNLSFRTIEGNEYKKLKTYKKGAVDNFIMLTPKVAATYGNIIIEDFKEKGADAADLDIETDDYEFLNISGGLSLSLNNTLSNGMLFRTVLNGYANNNIKNDKVELKARYEDDTEYFTVYGFETEKLTYNGGISFNLDFTENFGIGLGYDYIYSKETVGQLVRANMLIMF